LKAPPALPRAPRGRVEFVFVAVRVSRAARAPEIARRRRRRRRIGRFLTFPTVPDTSGHDVPPRVGGRPNAEPPSPTRPKIGKIPLGTPPPHAFRRVDHGILPRSRAPHISGPCQGTHGLGIALSRRRRKISRKALRPPPSTPLRRLHRTSPRRPSKTSPTRPSSTDNRRSTLVRHRHATKPSPLTQFFRSSFLSAAPYAHFTPRIPNRLRCAAVHCIAPARHVLLPRSASSTKLFSIHSIRCHSKFATRTASEQLRHRRRGQRRSSSSSSQQQLHACCCCCISKPALARSDVFKNPTAFQIFLNSRRIPSYGRHASETRLFLSFLFVHANVHPPPPRTCMRAPSHSRVKNGSKRTNGSSRLPTNRGSPFADQPRAASRVGVVYNRPTVLARTI
jgi:hypothetical protein